MKVRPVSITKSLLEEVDLDSEDIIAYTARVSNPANQMNVETAPKLLSYLLKNKHNSPFDMVDFTMEVKTSRAIAAQILRHWSFDFQEFSQRYAEVTEMEPVQLRKAGKTNRQSSSEEFDPLVADPYGLMEGEPVRASVMTDIVIQITQRHYKELLNAGVAKESARMVLPLTTQTTLYMKGSVRSWIFYLISRLDEHTQLEHRQLAQAIFPYFGKYFPTVVEALKLTENGLEGERPH